MGKKGQIAIEYLSMFIIGLILIIPVFIYYTTTKDSVELTKTSINFQNCLKEISDAVYRVKSSADGSNEIVFCNVNNGSELYYETELLILSNDQVEATQHLLIPVNITANYFNEINVRNMKGDIII